jgi:hypothetical protein
VELLVQDIPPPGIKGRSTSTLHNLETIAVQLDFVGPFRSLRQPDHRKTIHSFDETADCMGKACFFGTRRLVYSTGSEPDAVNTGSGKAAILSASRACLSGRAQWLPTAHLVEGTATLWALDYMGGETHQFVGLNFVRTQWADLREIEVGFSLEPRCHHPARPSAVRTGFRIIRWESRPRNTSDGRYRLCAPQSGHLAAMGWAGTDSTGAGMFSQQPLHWTTTRFVLSGPGNMETSIGEYKAKVIHSPGPWNLVDFHAYRGYEFTHKRGIEADQTRITGVSFTHNLGRELP